MLTARALSGLWLWLTQTVHALRSECALTADTSGDSSVGRASDCRMLQLSDGPWFDSGSPDFQESSLTSARGSEALAVEDAGVEAIPRSKKALKKTRVPSRR